MSGPLIADHAGSIDITFDVRTDAGGRDPDTYSATLRRYHQRLWSKALPDGRHFPLRVDRPGAYLYHRSEAGEFFLASDSITPTYSSWVALQPLLAGIPQQERDAFLKLAYTVGAYMVFPGNVIDGKQTINGARGLHPRIADRLDVTLECIRRHYRHEANPLQGVLQRYADFFALFGDFRGYVDFFLLQDLVTEEGGVAFFMPFDNFTTPPTPQDLASYVEYRRLTTNFIEARNERIAAWDAQTSREPSV